MPAALPVGIDFLGLPFSEPTLLRIGAAYEAATHHRMPPPDFGPLDEQRQARRQAQAGQAARTAVARARYAPTSATRSARTNTRAGRVHARPALPEPPDG